MNGDIHNGAFQTIINHYGERAEGKWIGFNKDNIVSDGPMVWTRLKENNNNGSIDKINLIGIKKYIETSNLKDIV